MLEYARPIGLHVHTVHHLLQRGTGVLDGVNAVFGNLLSKTNEKVKALLVLPGAGQIIRFKDFDFCHVFKNFPSVKHYDRLRNE